MFGALTAAVAVLAPAAAALAVTPSDISAANQYADPFPAAGGPRIPGATTDGSRGTTGAGARTSEPLLRSPQFGAPPGAPPSRGNRRTGAAHPARPNGTRNADRAGSTSSSGTTEPNVVQAAADAIGDAGGWLGALLVALVGGVAVILVATRRRRLH